MSDGYKRGHIYGPGWVHVMGDSCRVCGALVADKDLHDEYHANQSKVAQSAYMADVMTRPLGGMNSAAVERKDG